MVIEIKSTAVSKRVRESPNIYNREIKREIIKERRE